jgi:protocatechuate 3,4-dioxygenase beta subunit
LTASGPVLAAPATGEIAPQMIVSSDEPGEPLLLSGTVYAADGATPVSGARVHVHQTNQKGEYTRLGSSGSGDRIEGEFMTGPAGRYLFRTIRPASYPGNGPPAHVHYAVVGPDGQRRSITLHFSGDEELSAEQVRHAGSQGLFGNIQPLLPDDDGLLHCTFDIRMDR